MSALASVPGPLSSPAASSSAEPSASQNFTRKVEIAKKVDSYLKEAAVQGLLDQEYQLWNGMIYDYYNILCTDESGDEGGCAPAGTAGVSVESSLNRLAAVDQAKTTAGGSSPSSLLFKEDISKTEGWIGLVPLTILQILHTLSLRRPWRQITLHPPWGLPRSLQLL